MCISARQLSHQQGRDLPAQSVFIFGVLYHHAGLSQPVVGTRIRGCARIVYRRAFDIMCGRDEGLM
jgi:hypothetical protein